MPSPHPDVYVEDSRVVITHYDGVVRAGLGAVVFAGAGVTVDAQAGSEVHLAPDAALEEMPALGVLESLEVSVVPWEEDLSGPTGRAAVTCVDVPKDLTLVEGVWQGAA